MKNRYLIQWTIPDCLDEHHSDINRAEVKSLTDEELNSYIEDIESLVSVTYLGPAEKTNKDFNGIEILDYVQIAKDFKKENPSNIHYLSFLEWLEEQGIELMKGRKK